MPIVRRTLALGGKYTFEDARRARGLIAARAHLPLGAVRIEKHPSGRHDLAVVAMVREDPFKRRWYWNGPRRLGMSIVDPIDIGVAQDGEYTPIYIAGDGDRIGQHFLVMGMTGVGKSQAWRMVYADVLTRVDVAVIYADAVKGLQTAAPIIDGLTWFADTDASVKQVIRAIPRLISDRVAYLASLGLDDWEPDCGLEYLIIHIEEVAGIANRNFVKLAERARSAGISLVLSLQRASGDRMNTSVRYNLGASMCFGVRDIVDTKFALMQQTIDMGADPHTWQNRRRGMFYLEADGSDVARFAIPNKTLWLRHRNDLVECVKQGARHRCELSDVTVRALGSDFAQYRRDLARGETHWQRVQSGLIVPTLEIDASEDGEIEMRDVAVNDEVEARVSTRAADQIVWAWIEARREKGGEPFTFGEIKEAVLPKIERSPTWLNLRLKKLIDDGKLPSKDRSNLYRVNFP